jgi:hypothetical protein
MRILLLALGCSACANLAPIEASTCGNGVIEDREDCDAPGDPRCIACSLSCTSDDDCAALPAPRNGSAYRCGFDQPIRLCHAPGGEIGALAGVQPFDVLGFGVTDINADGIGDAVGLSATQLVARYGDPSGQLASAIQAEMPPLLGSPAVIDVNGDNAVDVVLPTRDGLVAYTGANATLVPYTFAIKFSNTGALQALDAVEVDATYAAAFFDTGGQLSLGMVSVALAGQQGGPPPPIQVCDGLIDPAKFDPSQVAIYDLTTVYGTPAIAFAVEAPRLDRTSELCAMTIVELSPGNFTATLFVPAGAAAGGGKPVLADLDPAAGGCPSLVLANRARYAANKVGGLCQLASATTSLAGSAMLGNPVGRVPLVPAIGGHAADALVLQGGIADYNTATGQLETLYISDRSGPLSLAAFGDIDGDARTDAVVAVSGATDVDVLYRLTTPVDGFLRFRVGTQDQVKMLATGDFDGNGLPDVLAVERVTTPTAAFDRIVIAYATRAQLLPPVAVGEFNSLLALTKVQLIDSTDQTGVVDDVAVIDQRPNDPTLLAILHGTPQRGLIPYLDPRGPGPGMTPPWLTSGFSAVVGGHFVSSDPAGSVDLLAISLSVTPGAQGTVWLMAGSGPGTVSARSAVQPIAATLCAAPGGGLFCANNAAFQPGRFGGGDIVIGFDQFNGNAVVIDPAQISNTTATLPLVASRVMPPLSVVTSTLVADTDGDGVNELIFGYVDQTTGAGNVVACTVSGASLDCSHDLFGNEPQLAGHCSAVALGAVTLQGQTPDSGRSQDLVIDCDSEVYRLEYAADGYHAVPLLALPFRPIGFGLADVTGDLVPDILITGSENGAPTLLVYPQCTSRGCK